MTAKTGLIKHISSMKQKNSQNFMMEACMGVLEEDALLTPS